MSRAYFGGRSAYRFGGECGLVVSCTRRIAGLSGALLARDAANLKWSGSFRQFEGQAKIVPDWF